MQAALGPARPMRIGLALSGGGDSMAMAALAAHWAGTLGVTLHACSVDHGLRPEAADEVELARRFCVDAGISHSVERWDHGRIDGNLQHAARQARYDLLERWAGRNGITHVALGHTQDDQAETLLLRLARGSGVDGLSAMRPARVSHGVTWLRPMLWIGRAELRAFLVTRGIEWADDPSNDDPRFDRIKTRQMMPKLGQLGLTRARIVETAQHMTRARDALNHLAARAADEVVISLEAGTVAFDAAALRSLPDDTITRLVAHALSFVSRAPYRPRYDTLIRALDAPKSTLHGCVMQQGAGRVLISRELNACEGAVEPGATWDGRWDVEGPFETRMQVAALGTAGLSCCADWRETGLPRDALLPTPAVWRGADLIAAPVAGFANGFTARLAMGCDDFNAGLVTH